MSTILKQFTLIAIASFITFSCAGDPEVINERTVNPALLGAEGLDEDLSAPLSLAGLGDRVCKLHYSFVKKKGTDFEVIAEDSISDNAKRSGFGRGCMNFCIATFDALRAENEKKGVSVLIKNCKFTGNPVAVAKAVDPIAPVAAPVNVADLDKGICKILGGAHNLLYNENVTENKCKTECDLRNEANPQRRCEYKGKVFRKHPKATCSIVGRAGKIHYQNDVRRFICRSECNARELTNPYRTCLWGTEVVHKYDGK